MWLRAAILSLSAAAMVGQPPTKPPTHNTLNQLLLQSLLPHRKKKDKELKRGGGILKKRSILEGKKPIHFITLIFGGPFHPVIFVLLPAFSPSRGESERGERRAREERERRERGAREDSVCCVIERMCPSPRKKSRTERGAAAKVHVLKSTLYSDSIEDALGQ